MLIISTVSHSSSQKTLVKRERDIVVKKSKNQEIIEIIDAQKISQTTSTKEAKTKK